MAIQIQKPDIEHKYITLFDTEEEFNAAYPDFSEVNWSDVAFPEERPDNYRISRRLSNMYHKDNPPYYWFDDINDTLTDGDVVYHSDGTYVGTFNENDDIRKTFFLEIVWGYSGWEWHEYELITGTDPETEEPITETLIGGNLYRIKNIETVPHIIDGDRLQHINDFLYSQYDVTTVNGFNTSNVKAVNRAFKRGTADDTSYPKRPSLSITECHLVDAYDDNENLLDHYFGYGDTLANVVEADELFYNNKIYINDDNPAGSYINIPNVEKINKFYYCGAYTPGLKFKMESLKEFTQAFTLGMFNVGDINVNDILIGSTLNHITDFSEMFAASSLVGTTQEINGTEYTVSKVIMDLTSSEVSQDDVLNLCRIFDRIGPREFNYSNTTIVSGTLFYFDLNFNNKVSLKEAFLSVMKNRGDESRYGIQLRNGGFERIRIDFHGKEQYITNLNSAFNNNTFIENLPIQQVPNNDCDDSYIYESCTFNVPVTYNFLNGNIVAPREQGYGQFNKATFNDTFSFSNIQGLDRVEFCDIKFGNDVAVADRAFPYVVQDQNDTTYRYFDMAGSKFTSMPAQNIYIDSARFRLEDTKYVSGDLNAARINPFHACSAFTDLSGVHLYFSDIDDTVERLVPKEAAFKFDFSGCTNMTKTPYIHFKYLRTYYCYLSINCKGLTNLTDVNFEYFSYNGPGTAQHAFTLQDCTNLVYLKLATSTADGVSVFLDLRGCTSLDTSTLRNTLLNINRGMVLFLKSTWSVVNNNDLDHGPVRTYFDEHNIRFKYIDDNEYVPGSNPNWT